MKNSYSTNQECSLASGTRILGKWHRQSYKVIRKLGAGASGTVYLANSASGLVALKISTDNMSITSEVNVLKHFSKAQEHILGPSLLDVDDYLTQGRTYPFYVMEYLKGKELISYLQNRGGEWLGILIIQLLGDLERLHKAGWVFGDLKPDNILVVGPPARIRLLDVGGTTIIGRSIKEYTEFFDRGYWGLGLRKAEPSYDLFAVAMIMINSAYPERFEKQGDKPFQLLKRRVEEQRNLDPFRYIILRAIQGEFNCAGSMRDEMIIAVSKGVNTRKVKDRQNAAHQHPKKKTRTKVSKSNKSSYFIEIFLLISFLLLAYILYLFGQMM